MHELATGARFAHPNNSDMKKQSSPKTTNSDLFFQALAELKKIAGIKVTKFRVTPQQKASLIPEPELSQLDLIRLIQGMTL